ncbi:MAG: DUF167 domain-containing protein [Aeromicrobium sp.]|uniref:DUF167 domain-containing protein n=1 Tax=Aeromicrobium sp. TaxID=1871063 RepID=UPI0039E51D58
MADERVIRVRVKPGSKKGPLVEPSAEDGVDLVVFTPERAVDGKANAAVEKLIAAHAGVPKSRVTITSGHTSRLKRLRVTF